MVASSPSMSTDGSMRVTTTGPGGCVTSSVASALTRSAPLVTAAEIVVFPVARPVARHPLGVTLVEATPPLEETHVQLACAPGSPPAMATENSVDSLTGILAEDGSIKA